MWVVVSVVAVVVAVATYVTWLATRVDRLHVRAAAALDALNKQSRRRADAAEDLGERESLEDVMAAVRAVRESTDNPTSGPGSPAERRVDAENLLTRRLRAVAPNVEPDKLTDVVETSRRLALARQVYSDRVRDAQNVRRRRLVNLLGLVRRHPAPEFIDIDDPAL